MDEDMIFGIILYDQFKLDKAMEVFERKVIDQPELADAWYYLGKINQRKQDYGKALNCFQTTLELIPGHVGARTGTKHIQDILKLTNNFYFENAYTDEGLYEDNN
jgi:tetratricopeptide (TPR) repeat protein